MSSPSPSVNRATSAAEVTDALARIRQAKVRRLLGNTLATSAVVGVGAQGLTACAVDSGDEVAAEQEQAATDWTRGEGERNTAMVQYRGDFWTESSQCNTRAGCMVLDAVLKVFVKPVAAANLDTKRVGVVFRLPYWEPDEYATATGTYFSTVGDMEEWHVRIRMRPWERPLIPVFNAWYQDGLGHTYYDDNEGEYHVAAGHDRPLSQAWCCIEEANDVQVTDQGVEGGIGLRVVDLDWDKEIEIVWTTDQWQTANTYGLGDGLNAWYWTRDLYSGQDVFRIDLDIPGDVEQFEYAVVYRHGVVNGAVPYEFWDNNGGNNYVVTRGAPQ